MKYRGLGWEKNKVLGTDYSEQPNRREAGDHGGSLSPTDVEAARIVPNGLVVDFREIKRLKYGIEGIV
jgi:hypothetical protein